MSDPTSPGTCLILDPGLRVSSGHHLNAARHIRDVAAELGFETPLLASRFATRAVVQGLGAHPVFTNSAYSTGDGTPKAYDRYARTTFDALVSGLGPAFPLPELIVMPTGDAALAEALGRYLELFPKDLRPGVVTWLLLPRDFLRMNTPDSAGGAARGFHRLDAAVPAGRLRVFGETTAVQASFARDFSVPIELAPSPSTALQALGPRRKVREGPITFSAFGHIRPGKGFELLPGAIAHALAARPDIRFCIHATPHKATQADLDLLAAFEALGPNVEVIGREVSGAEYARLLERADVAVLPYDPAVYGERGSGIFNECAQLGTPVLATKGCSFAEAAIAANRAVEIVDYSPQALGDAIIAAADGFEDLSARCYAHALDLADGSASPDLGAVLRETARAAGARIPRPKGALPLFLRARMLHRLREVARITTIRKARAHDSAD
ncbi:MAG: glycosyltransferase [Pseudomonadota bacterium]